MWRTVGSEKLRGFLETFGQSQLAARLGVTQQAVSYWATGKRRPMPHVRVSLAGIAGIPEHDWLTEDERAAIQKAAAA